MRYARVHGMNVGLGEVKDTFEASRHGTVSNSKLFKHTLKSICCGTYDDVDLFEELYAMYWLDEGGGKHNVKIKSEYHHQDESESSLILLGKGESSDNEGRDTDAKTMSGANTMEKIRKTDFAKLDDIDPEFFNEIAHKLWKQMSFRMKRRMKVGRKGNHIDFSRTIRKSISKGGWPTEIVNKQRKKTKKRLVMLLDISGSMDKYSLFLLKFIFVLKQYFETIEAFTFSTEIQRITPHLKIHDLRKVYEMISDQVESWSSGTRIGECLKEFNINYSKNVLSRSSIVIILSDGLDTGDPAILENAIKEIKLKTKQLIWLNPLKGMKDYEPIQRGMSAALPAVDEFHSAHNLDSLLELENYLGYV